MITIPKKIFEGESSAFWCFSTQKGPWGVFWLASSNKILYHLDRDQILMRLRTNVHPDDWIRYQDHLMKIESGKVVSTSVQLSFKVDETDGSVGDPTHEKRYLSIFVKEVEIDHKTLLMAFHVLSTSPFQMQEITKSFDEIGFEAPTSLPKGIQADTRLASLSGYTDAKLIQKYTDLTDSKLYAFWQMDLKTNKVQWSKALYEMYKVPEGISLDFDQVVSLFDDSSKKKLSESISQSIENGSSYDIILYGHTYNGAEQVIVRALGNPIIEDGRCVELYGQVFDVTELYVLRQQQDLRLKGFFNNPIYGVLFMKFDEPIAWTKTSDRIDALNKAVNTAKVEEVNEALLEQFQVKREDIIGTEAVHFFEEDIAKLRRIFFRTINLGQAPYESRMRLKNGEVHFFKSNYFSLKDDNGLITGIFGLFQDVTLQRQNEKQLIRRRKELTKLNERMKVAAVMARLAFWTYDIQSSMLSISDELDGLLQISRNNGTIQLDQLRERVHPEDWPLFSRSLALCIRKGLPYKIEIRLIIPERNEYVTLEVKGQPRHNSKGTYDEIFGITRDISEERKLRDDLKSSEQQAQAANQAKSEFLANMSHEIRTPLNAILGYSELLENTRLDKTQEGYLSVVKATGGSLIEIVNDILDVSKIEAGKMRLDPIGVSVPSFFSDLRQMVAYQAKKKNLPVIFKIDENIPHALVFDPVRLRQVLLNLLSNAIKFTDNGYVHLMVESLNEHMYRFSVQDTGKGIKEDQLEQIFQIFTQEDISITRRYGGTGLGLNICNGILRLMESELSVHSEEGVGSIFSFNLALESFEGELDVGTQEVRSLVYVGENEEFIQELEACKGKFNVDCQYLSTAIDLFQGLKELHVMDLIILDEEQTYLSTPHILEYLQDRYSTEKFAVCTFIDEFSQLNPEKYDNYRFHFLAKELKSMVAVRTMLEEKGYHFRSTAQENKWANAPISVLIVEDNEINMALFENIIQLHLPEAKLYKARNGADAVERFKRIGRELDMVFMDIQMPEMDGYQATVAIRKLEDGKEIPIVAVSAGILKGEQDRAIDAGMNAFISKPISQKAIMEAFKRFLVQPKLETTVKQLHQTEAEEVKSAPSSPLEQDLVRTTDVVTSTDKSATEEWHSLAVMDEAAFMDTIGGDSGLATMLAEKTLEFFGGIESTLEGDIASENFKQFDRDLHELVGVSRSMQLTKLTRYGELIRVEKGYDTQKLRQIMKTLGELLREAEASLERMV